MLSIKKAFLTTNRNLIIPTPQILYIIVASLFLKMTMSSNVKQMIVSLVVYVLMTGAFFAGWFAMIKEAVVTPENETKTSNELLKVFLQGVGNKFLTYTAGVVLYSAMLFGVALAAYKCAVKYIGQFPIPVDVLNSTINSPETLKQFVASMPVEDLIKVNQWNMLFLLFILVFMFLTMFWIPEIEFGGKNIFISFFNSVKNLFKKFFKSLVVFLFILFLYFLVSLFSTFAMSNNFMYFVSVLLSVYSTAYFVVLLFQYYEEQIEGRCDSRSDCEREDQTCN